MDDRLILQAMLEEILGSRNVYFNPPADVRMKYDAIRYELSGKDLKRANNKIYKITNQYDGVIITRNPDTDIPDKLLSHFEMCSFGRPYTADNLNHYPFTLYY
jgi:hypothetical protein